MRRPRVAGEEILLNIGIEKFGKIQRDEQDKDDGVKRLTIGVGFFKHM